jgi:O-antigen ligase
VERIEQLFFGSGLGPDGRAVFETKLRERGLSNHLWYNAHNQYLTTFFHTGLVGLFMLVSIVFYCIWLGYKSEDRVMFFFSILTALSMMSESVFERVNGTVFFSLILLMMSGSSRRERKAELSKLN